MFKMPFSNLSLLKKVSPILLLAAVFPLISAGTASGQPRFVVRPIALTATSGQFGPQLNSTTTFTGFNGWPHINSDGDITFPGNLSPAFNGSGEGFWLNQNGMNTPILLSDSDGALGPGLGQGVVINDTFHDGIVGPLGTVLIGGSLVGPGVTSENNRLYVLHRQSGNVPLARTGVDETLGPGLGDDVVFNGFYPGQLNTNGNIVLHAGIAGPGIDNGNDLGFWRVTDSGNIALVRTGTKGSLGPGLDEDVVFGSAVSSPFSPFEQYQLINASDEFLFVGRTTDNSTQAGGIGIWRNAAGANVPLMLSGVTGDVGPGLESLLTFAGPSQIPFGELSFGANSQGAMAFFSTLEDGRRGLWRNLGTQNEPLMLVGASGPFGPGSAIQDTFADFNRTDLFPDPAINDRNEVLFPGLLSSSHKQGLWLRSGEENKAIALTGDDGALGPGLGPGVTFTGFNRAYFGNDDTVYFTADLNHDVPFNRLLGFWAYRSGRITPIAVYDEMIDVDPTIDTDMRQVRWVQIPDDYTWLNSYGVNDSNQITFRMGFQDGTQGIFLAMPIPEPGTLLLCTMFAVASLTQWQVARTFRPCATRLR